MRHARGFSLVELIVAMTVTLIISSAIYGLLTSGSNAFRREPEVADRQQNIRAAMDLITRDAYAAGAGLPTFSQVFTATDPPGGCVAGLNGCAMPGAMGAVAAAARGGDSENSDVLEIASTDEQCPTLGICSAGPAIAGNPGLFVVQEARPQCLNVPGLAVLAADTAWTIAAITAEGGGTPCTTGGAAPPNANLTLTGALPPFTAVGFNAAANPNPGSANAVYLYRARLARYRIAVNPDPLDPVPSLWRSDSGRYLPNGNPTPEPGTAGFDPAGSPWQLVARGIEDLQVEYRGGAGVWSNQPPVSLANGWPTLVLQVRITLSARATAPNLLGESTGAGGAPNAVRGQLSAVVTPRPAFQEMQNCLSATVPCTAAEHIQ
jgi:prepilin-type N-terminal cleavage/methylation domain-containing protein